MRSPHAIATGWMLASLLALAAGSTQAAAFDDAISREVSVYNEPAVAAVPDAVSREVSAFNDPAGSPGFFDAISRESTLFNNIDASGDPDHDDVLTDDGDQVSDPCRTGASLFCDDNCPFVANPDQTDTDANGVGDVCAPPQVNDVFPAGNALEVALATNVTVDFSEPIAAPTVTVASFQLLANGSPVPASVNVAPSQLRATLDPAAPLDRDTLYTVRVTSGVTDASGAPAVPFTSLFRTTATASGGETLPSGQADGPAPVAHAGASIAGAGDLNGDGINDWIVGAPSYQAPDGAVEAGAVLVYLGSADATERETPDIIFTGIGAHDRTGVAVAGAFEFGGDGRPDILIGAEQFNRTAADDLPLCAAGAPCGAGRAYLIFFRPADYPHLGDASIPDVVDLSRVANGQPDQIPGIVFVGQTLGDRAGFSVAGGGRIDSGSADDLLIGAPGRSVPPPQARPNAGTVYAVFGQPLGGVVPLGSVASGAPGQVAGIVYRGATQDELGSSVAFVAEVCAGQSGGTTRSNPSMGAPGSGNRKGKVVVPKGGSSDTSAIDVDTVGVTVPGFRIIGAQPGEGFGWTIGNGKDNRADGAPDLLVGAPFYDSSAGPDAGRLIQISQQLATGVYAADNVGVSIAGVIWTGQVAGDRLGESADGVGDVSGDGFDDVVIGAPGFDPVIDGTTRIDAGAVYLLAGGATPAYDGTKSVAEIGVTVAGTRLVGTQGANATSLVPSGGEHAGAAVAWTGDIDGNHDVDFAVGAPDRDATPSSTDTGSVYLVTSAKEPPPGACGVGASCTIADLPTGAQLYLQAGSLATATQLVTLGILDAAALPAPAPAGQLFLGGIATAPAGLTLGKPGTASIPIAPGVQGQLRSSEEEVWYWNGAAWIDRGTGVVTANVQYPARKAVTASVGALGVWAAFASDADSDGLRDERDNCPNAANAAQEDSDHDGPGDACDPCTDTDGDGRGNPGLPATVCALDNCPAISNPSQADGELDGVGDVCDDCPLVANASQSDSDLDGIGDACDTNPVLRVRCDGGADAVSVQQAIDAAVPSGTRIELQPCVYTEHVVLSRGKSFEIVGVGGPVTVDGTGGPAFSVVSEGSAPTSFRNLILRGATGIRADVSTRLEDVRFETTSLALDLRGGSHSATGLVMDASVDTGFDVAAGASLVLDRSRLLNLAVACGTTAGALTLDTVLVGAGATGLRVNGSGSLTVRNSTLAGGAGIGILRDGNGDVHVSSSIVYGNQGADLAGLPCAVVSWSVVGVPDCSATGNLASNPRLAADFHLLPESPAHDFGLPSQSFNSYPCLDLDGAPRLADWNGDGSPVIDPGAFEAPNPMPFEVGPLSWQSMTRLTWNAVAGATAYHVYRDELSSLRYDHVTTCRDDLDPVRTDQELVDPQSPGVGTGFAYLISAAGGGRQGSLGSSRCAERSNFLPCP